MKIRREQVQTLDEIARADLYRRLAAYLRRTLPEYTNHLTEAALLERITAAARRSEKYGVKSDVAVSEFVCLSIVAGEKFDEIPDVHKHLTQSLVTPDMRVRLLAQQLVSNMDDYVAGQRTAGGPDAGDRS